MKDPSADESYITVYRTHLGYYKAIWYWWNPDMGGFWEPWDTGKMYYVVGAQAELEARAWANDVKVKFVPTGAPPPLDPRARVIRASPR